MKKSLFLTLLMLVFTSGVTWAQTKVTGKITSATDGAPVPFAYVMVEGTTVGVQSDANGDYQLTVPAGKNVLVFSSIGLKTLNIDINGRAVINVVMEEDQLLLDDVVIVGYGTQRKRDVTSSISQIKGGDLADKASSSFMQQMAGRASGVQVISSSADLGTPPRIIIRGVSTISSGTSPLYVINGVPVTSGNLGGSYTNNNAMADINPADIESFEILKDGAATAIYGSRAANGVVLITTKTGRQGTAKVTYDGWAGWAQASKLYDLLDASQFVEIANEKYANVGGQPQAFMDDKGTDTRWFDHIFRTGFQHSHTVSVAGGSEKTQYYISGGYTGQKGIVRSNEYDRFTFYGKIDQKILNNYVTVGLSFNGSFQENTGPVKGTNSLSDNMFAGVRMLPNVPVFDETHPTGYNIDRITPKALGRGANKRIIESDIPNIVWALDNNVQKNASWRLLPNLYVDVKPVKWLSYKFLLGADISLLDNKYAWDPASGDGLGYKGLIIQTFYRRQRWNMQNILSFNKDFGKHHVDATAVAEWTNYTSSSYNAGAREISDPFFMDQIISSTYATQSSGGGFTSNGLASYIFRANYNYNSMLYVGGSIRYDGLSRLPKDTRWGTFYGVSAAFRLSELGFWKKGGISKIINDFRIRGSYAQVGNDQIGDFPFVNIFSAQKYGSQNGLAYYQCGNPDLKWEKQNIMDVGFDMAFLNSRFNFSFAYWSKKNTDIVLDVPTPPSLGIPWNNISQNYGTIDNNGIELEVSGNIISTKNFQWRSSLNFSTQKSKVVKLVSELPYEQYVIREGESIRALWGYEYAGVNKANGNPMYYKADGTVVQGNPVNSKYYVYDPANPKDMSKAANLTDEDKKILGNSIPTWFGGFDNTLFWKGFDLNIFFRFSGGNKVANITRRDMLNQGFQNNSTEILGRWQSEANPGDGKTPKLYYGKENFINLSGEGSSRWVEDGSFLKLQNLSLGYNIPGHICKKIKLEKVRVYVQAQNLWTITGYSGLDPEVYTSQVGVDWNGNPQQRVFTIGLNIGF